MFYNFTIPKGTHYTKSFQWTDSADSPIPLDNYEIQMVVETNPVTTWSTSGTSPKLVKTATVGEWSMILTDEYIVTLPFRFAPYRVIAVLNPGSDADEPTELFRGEITIQ